MPKQKNFKTQKEVLDYLNSKGLAIKKSKFSLDYRLGRIGKNKKGFFEQKAVDDYAKFFVKSFETGKTENQDNADLIERKIKAETQKLEAQAQKEEFKLRIEKGLYIEKSKLFLELAGRASVLENGFKNLFQKKILGWIETVEGNKDKASELLEKLNDDIDILLNNYSKEMEFKVGFGSDTK